MTVPIGWQPAMIWTFSTQTTGPASNRSAALKIASMPGAAALAWSTAALPLSDAITITSTGFMLGSDAQVNKSGTTFYWMAVRASPAIVAGMYTGDGIDGQSILTGWQPNPLWVAQMNLTERALLKSDVVPSAQGYEYEAAVSLLMNVLTLTSTGFIGEGNANISSAEYHYVAGTNQVQPRTWRSGIYTGSGALQTVALGEQPKYLQIMDVAMLGFKTPEMPASNFAMLDTKYSWETPGTGIVLISTGFQLDGTRLNELGTTYFYIAGIH